MTSNRTAVLNNPSDVRNGQVVKDTDSTANNVMMQVGYQFNPYLALEGRYTTSVGDFSLTHQHLNGFEEDANIDLSHMGIYLKPMYPARRLSLSMGYLVMER